MILYKGTAKEFSDAVETNQIIRKLEEAFRAQLGRNLPRAEVGAYSNSLSFMERVVRRSGVPDDCGILVEYVIPLTSNRIDFVIAGHDDVGKKNFVIVELKQWQKATATESDGVVRTYLNGGERETTHPSYQAYSYKQFLTDFNENIARGHIRAHACAYLHNFVERNPEPLVLEPYSKVVSEAPIYFRDDQDKLEDFLLKYVPRGRGVEILYEIESGKIRPSKKLVEHVSDMFKGNQEFILLDQQKVAFEEAKRISKKCESKSVVIIKGGPGTGKSVISVNLLGNLLKEGLNTVFVAPNAAFREVIVKQLAREHSPQRLKNLFKGSGSFVDSNENDFDVLIVDEAHRLKRRGAYMYRGENQIEDLIKAAKTTIFFVDDDQAIRPEDIGSVSEIRRIAGERGARMQEIELVAQFRCSGAEGYVNWLNDALHIRQTGNFDGWDSESFDFRIFDNPNELRDAIKQKHEKGERARVLAGYAWEWTAAGKGNQNGEIADVKIPEFDFNMPWNSRRIGSTWAIDAEGIHQVGCVHTSQGLEFDYVGVIVGNDLSFNTESLSYSTDYEKYKDVQGKRGLKENPKELNRLVRNIYKVLMTRGMKGCYVYFSNPELAKYFKSRLRARA